MPGSIQNAQPTTVLPPSLCRAFTHERAYPLVENEYKNASRRGRCWRPPAVSGGRKGTTEAFYFYDPYETSPKFSYDPTGQVTTGRYTVRFNSDWQQSSGPARSDVDLELLELA